MSESASINANPNVAGAHQAMPTDWRSRALAGAQDRGKGGEGAQMMKSLAIIAALVLSILPALAQPLPQPKPPGPGGSCPHGYMSSGSFCVLSFPKIISARIYDAIRTRLVW